MRLPPVLQIMQMRPKVWETTANIGLWLHRGQAGNSGPLETIGDTCCRYC